MAHHDQPAHRRRTAARAAASMVGMIAVCVLAAGCGGASHKSPTSSSAASAQLAFSKCMRAHGVPDFPDPGTPSGAGENSIGGIAIPSTINMQSPAFQRAENSCRGLFAAAFSPKGKPPITASMKASLIIQAQCMRTHGVPGYPDPKFPASGGIEIFDSPAVNQQSPAFKHAQAICGHR